MRSRITNNAGEVFCSLCEEFKAIEEYGLDRSRPMQITSLCLNCRRERNTEYYARNKDKVIKSVQNRRKSHKKLVKTSP